MLSEFRLPDVGEGISEAEIVRWLVAEGATVNEDQDIVEIETDKAIVALPSPHSGKIAKLHRKEGDLSNAGYWYRRAGKPVAGGALEAEWEAIARALL